MYIFYSLPREHQQLILLCNSSTPHHHIELDGFQNLIINNAIEGFPKLVSLRIGIELML